MEQTDKQEQPNALNRLVLNVRTLWGFSLVYLAAAAAAEIIIYYKYPVWGIVLYLFILFSLIAGATLSKNRDQQALWLALGLAPLTRIVSLAMPVLLQISQFIWYIVISVPVLVGIIAVARTLKYSLADVGIQGSLPLVQILTAVWGLLLGAVAYIWLKPAAWTDSLTLQSTLFPSLVLLIFTGFVEELAFRGVMQRAAGALGSYGWILIAAVYAVLQIQQGSYGYCLLALGAGLYFGWMVKNTGSIFGASLAHGLINIGLYLLFPHIFNL